MKNGWSTKSSLSARQDGAFLACLHPIHRARPHRNVVHRAVIAVICATRRAWCLLFSSFVVWYPSCRSRWPSVLLRVCFFVVEICGSVRDLSFFICFCCCCVRIPSVVDFMFWICFGSRWDWMKCCFPSCRITEELPSGFTFQICFGEVSICLWTCGLPCKPSWDCKMFTAETKRVHLNRWAHF